MVSVGKPRPKSPTPRDSTHSNSFQPFFRMIRLLCAMLFESTPKYTFVQLKSGHVHTFSKRKSTSLESMFEKMRLRPPFSLDTRGRKTKPERT